ncbi:solute carrier family 35 member B1 isoform X2 [Cephus cinctus]|uniref:Solute carrier family 35 member B1 isoform X2 n=1 Tax=Cephus cinctus TaxID=211228 RepID=A0AAJ7C5M8_CEPCN|nr:solute carrier family 35 member B1 isoform X2 [Cephus cinctus]
MVHKSTRIKLLICAGGIFICYFYFGVLQEKITRGSYGEDGNKEKFTYVFALVFVQCLVNYAFAKIILLTVMKQGEDNTRTLYYATSSLTYLLGMVSSNMALQFVSYPTQVVGKAGKPIPVMILGVLLGKKVYPMRKYLFVLLIVIGVALFIYKDHKGNTVQTDAQMGFGELLLFLSLIMDGLTGAVQERMRDEHKSQSGHMMLNMNFWFLQRHPNAVWHLISFSAAGALGQFFIFLTVAEFGPLTCSVMTTTRKFFTVLGSVLLFGNNLLPRQWIATVIVFSGLFLDAMYGKTKMVIKETLK